MGLLARGAPMSLLAFPNVACKGRASWRGAAPAVVAEHAAPTAPAVPHGQRRHHHLQRRGVQPGLDMQRTRLGRAVDSDAAEKARIGDQHAQKQRSRAPIAPQPLHPGGRAHRPSAPRGANQAAALALIERFAIARGSAMKSASARETAPVSSQRKHGRHCVRPLHDGQVARSLMRLAPARPWRPASSSASARRPQRWRRALLPARGVSRRRGRR